jgi:hypothetical protein
VIVDALFTCICTRLKRTFPDATRAPTMIVSLGPWVFFYGSFLFLFQLTNDLFCSFLGYNCVTTTRQRRNDTATPPLRATARRVDNGNRNDDNGGENHNGTRGRERQRDDGAGNDDDEGSDEETRTASPTVAVSICSQGGSLRDTHAREQLLAGWIPRLVAP